MRMRPAVVSKKRGNQVHKRRFAGAARPDKREDLSPMNVKVDTEKHLFFALFRRVAEADILQSNSHP